MQTSLGNINKLAMSNIEVIEEEARVLDELTPEKETGTSPQQNEFKGSIIVSQSSVQGFIDLQQDKKLDGPKDD